MSWWIQLDRQSFNQALEERFAVNRADAPRRGTVQKPRDLKAHSSRGGKAKRSSYESHAEIWERRKRSA